MILCLENNILVMQPNVCLLNYYFHHVYENIVCKLRESDFYVRLLKSDLQESEENISIFHGSYFAKDSICIINCNISKALINWGSMLNLYLEKRSFKREKYYFRDFTLCTYNAETIFRSDYIY